jgi:predicted RNase H-like HicB family nuclease
MFTQGVIMKISLYTDWGYELSIKCHANGQYSVSWDDGPTSDTEVFTTLSEALEHFKSGIEQTIETTFNQ